MDALKPCPFCGSPARLVEDSDHHGKWFNLGCGSDVPDQGEPCPAHYAFYTCDPSEKANAVTAWNTRVPPPSASVEAEPVAWRPEVIAFATLMEQQLRENDWKGGWRGVPEYELLGRLKEETEELCDALTRRATLTGERLIENVGREAADVANFAMMIADVCGALPTPPAPVEAVSKERFDLVEAAMQRHYDEVQRLTAQTKALRLDLQKAWQALEHTEAFTDVVARMGEYASDIRASAIALNPTPPAVERLVEALRAALLERLEAERKAAAEYPLGDLKAVRHGGIRDGLKEALEALATFQEVGR